MEQLRVAATKAPAAGAFLEKPWRALVGVARSISDQAVQSEYDTLFGGTGKPAVYLYGSHFNPNFPLAPMPNGKFGMKPVPERG